jgi:hypothetical protein
MTMKTSSMANSTTNIAPSLATSNQMKMYVPPNHRQETQLHRYRHHLLSRRPSLLRSTYSMFPTTAVEASAMRPQLHDIRMCQYLQMVIYHLWMRTTRFAFHPRMSFPGRRRPQNECNRHFRRYQTILCQFAQGPRVLSVLIKGTNLPQDPTPLHCRSLIWSMTPNTFRQEGVP